MITQKHIVVTYMTKEKILISQDIYFDETQTNIQAQESKPHNDLFRTFLDQNTNIQSEPIQEEHIPSIEPTLEITPQVDLPPTSPQSDDLFEETRHISPEKPNDHEVVPMQLPRCSSKFRSQSVKLDDNILTLDIEDFETCLATTTHDANNDNIMLQKALQHPGWTKAMKDELESINRNDTWDLLPLSTSKHPISASWVFKTRPRLGNQPPRLKARLFARGFEQKCGTDYDEVFAPVVKWSTIRTLTATAASMQQNIYHLDVKTTFLYGHLSDEVYLEQPPGFVIMERKTWYAN